MLNYSPVCLFFVCTIMFRHGSNPLRINKSGIFLSQEANCLFTHRCCIADVNKLTALGGQRQAMQVTAWSLLCSSIRANKKNPDTVKLTYL